MQHGLFGRASRQVYGGVSLNPRHQTSVGNNPTTARMVKNVTRNSRVTRVSSTTLATQKNQIQQSVGSVSRPPPGTTPNPARNYRFFQAAQAKRRATNSASNARRGGAQGTRSAGGAAAAAGGSGGDGGDGKWPRRPANDHKYYPAPKALKAFRNARLVRGKTPRQGGSGLRDRWKDKDNIYEWDYQHGTVEKYNKRGIHQGEFDAETGRQIKPPIPGRNIKKFL